MKLGLVPASPRPILEVQSAIERIDQAVEIVEGCFNRGTNRLLLLSEHLPDTFSDLRTCFAGEFIQKLLSYHVYVAAVFADVDSYSGKFRDYLCEAKRGPQFRVFAVREAAIEWLAGQD